MIRLVANRLLRAELRTRLPFQYGITTLTHLPHLFLRATCEIDGCVQAGSAADHLPPKWFTKDPARDPVDEIDDMLRVIRHAVSAATGIRAPSVFAFWHELHARQSAWGETEKLPPLLVNFGTSLVERAMIDAFTRHRQTPFHRLLLTDALGLDLGAIHPTLTGSRAADWLPAAPLASIVVRHTVGLSDPLLTADIAPETRLNDGLPQSLEECVTAQGLCHFKIKLSGRPDRDIDRLGRIAAVLARLAPPDYAFSLDGNENFRSAADFRAFWAGVAAHPALRDFLGHLLFVEQPLHRDAALDAVTGGWTQAWPDRPPIIIDESDAGPDCLHRALELGYAGTSHKNCKGVFKGVAHACRIAQLRHTHPERGYLMSGEDLSNIGPVALLQDLAVQAALGNASVERNGHHYFAGLSFWPAAWQAAMRNLHPDLYRGDHGHVRLDVRAGRLRLGTVNAAPFGTEFLPESGDSSGLTEIPVS